MNAVSSTDDIEKCAAEWILRREREDFSAADRAALEAWLAGDSRRGEVFLTLDEAWGFTAGLKQWHPRDGRIDPDLLAPLAVRRESTRPRFIALMAASLVLAMGALSWSYFASPGGERYSTPIGGYERVALEDGSIVQLNTDTVVQAHFTASRREVRLLKGEAHFEVAKDSRRPFEVTIGKTIARAVGTAFSVRLDANEQVELVVMEGRVMLLPNGRIGSEPLVVAGHSASTKARGVSIAPVAHEEMLQHLAWQSGQLVFIKQPLAQVAEEFNRYNRRRVEIASPSLSSLELTGNFKTTDLASFVAAVESAANVEVRQSAEAVVITSTSRSP